MKAPSFEYVRPKTLAEALQLLARHGEDAKPIAGGQSLLPALNLRLSQPALLIDIGRLPELMGVAREGGMLRLGALTRHTELLSSKLVAADAPLLARAAAHIAHPAIRSRGTLGGSLANADPAAELPACALALGARLIAQSAARGSRAIAAEAFFTGLFATALLPDELLVAVELEPAGEWTGFAELSRRSGDYAMIGLAAQGRREGGRFVSLRLGFFSAGAVPVLARKAAEALKRDAADLDAAVAALAEDLPRHDDLQASAETRLHLAGVLLRRVVGGMATGVEPGLERGVIPVNLTVNGEAVAASVLPRTHLADFLREGLGLTGTHLGCEHGVCGACTVRLEGEIVRGCLVLAVQADGLAVETIEGVSDTGEAADLQAEFARRNALQCGYCTPGMLLAALDLLRGAEVPSRAAIREHLSGNYCRCTGYHAIVDAVEATARARAAAR